LRPAVRSPKIQLDGRRKITKKLVTVVVVYFGRKELRLVNSRKRFPHNVTLNDKKNVWDIPKTRIRFRFYPEPKTCVCSTERSAALPIVAYQLQMPPFFKELQSIHSFKQSDTDGAHFQRCHICYRYEGFVRIVDGVRQLILIKIGLH